MLGQERKINVLTITLTKGTGRAHGLTIMLPAASINKGDMVVYGNDYYRIVLLENTFILDIRN